MRYSVRELFSEIVHRIIILALFGTIKMSMVLSLSINFVLSKVFLNKTKEKEIKKHVIHQLDLVPYLDYGSRQWLNTCFEV